jgi:2',3'-cyclic-nucleotide 2'-phosphodiesterase/3'-nucleotidase
MLATFAVLTALAFQTPDTARVVLVATTDFHGQLGWDDFKNAPAPGGLARAATVVDSLRQAFPGQVVVVDAGDVIEGSPFASYFNSAAPEDPHPLIGAMNLIGYDVATPGDHEFDYGVGLMNRAIAAATFPFVSGNIRVIPGDTLALRPYIVLQRQGVRIGVAGFTTPGVMASNGSLLRGKIRVTPPESELDGVMKELYKDADVGVVLIHSGLDGPSSYDTTGIGGENAAARLALSANRPDIVILGHSHQEIIDSVLGGVHFVQPRAFGRSLAVVRLKLVRQEGRWSLVDVRAERVLLDKVPAAPRLERRMADKQAAVSAWMGRVIGEAAAPMRAGPARAEDTPLFRYVNDVQRRAARADLASTPVFDIRAGFDEGEISIAQVEQLYPKDYTLKAIRISGEQLKAYLEQNARYWFVDTAGAVFINAVVPPTNYDVLLGAEFAIDLSRPVGSRIAGLSVKGRLVAPTDSFTLALSNFRQSAAGGFPALRNARVVYDQGQSIRELIIADIRGRRTLDPAPFAATSWHIVPEASRLSARALFVRAGTVVVAAPIAAGPALLPPRVVVKDTLDLSLPAGSTAVATLKLPAKAGPGGGLLRLMADAYRSATRADLSIVAAEEAAQDLPAGPLDDATLKAAVPGEDRLIRLTMRGEDLQWVFEHIVEREVPCCEISGATLTYAPAREAFSRTRQIRFSSGRGLEEKKTYSVIISERLVRGESFVLGATRCGPGVGCAQSGLLGRWPFERSEQTGAVALRDYLHRLPQPVAPPDALRLIPAH